MAKTNNEVSGWVGWIGFASFMLLLGGAFSLIAGFVALFKDTVVYHSASNTAWVLDYTQWGWIHMLAGILAIVAAGSLMSGHMYGRIVAVLIALLSAVANLAFIPVYPIWSTLIILIDIMVIFAVTVHGGELKDQ
ncbi:hypothetical protein KW803_01590 [Candidatus Saccharibacteria bacterium]|nr:hypothetical protein [Candidatus Saccharibacteria bacterium]